VTRREGSGRRGSRVEAQLLNECQAAFEDGAALRAKGRYADAMAKARLARSLSGLSEAILGNDHLAAARCLGWAGEMYQAQEDYSQARPLLERALAIRESRLAKGHLDVAVSLNDLATLYTEQGAYDRALPLHERALAIREAALGETHPDIATSLNNLAILHSRRGSYREAEALYVRAQDMYAATLGKTHPLFAQSLNNLATLYSQRGEHDRAEPLFERALAIRQAALGRTHPEVAVSLVNLAGLHVLQGQYGRARPLLERALAIHEKTGGAPPGVATPLSTFADLLSQEGRYGQAEPLFERALAIREAALGKAHPLVAASLNDLAGLYYEQGRYDRAEPLFERALAIHRTALGEEHPDVASSLNNLALLYYQQGQHDRASPLLERALAIREATLGAAHPDTASSMNNLANVYLEHGQHDRARALLERALAIREAALGKDHPLVAGSLNGLAQLFMRQGAYERAEPLYERALAIREATLGRDHPLVAVSLQNLAVLYAFQGLHGRAEPLFARALGIWEATFQDGSHPDTAKLLRGLATIRMRKGDLPGALPLLARTLAVSERRLRREALDFSEARLGSLLRFLGDDEERFYSLVRAYPGNPEVRRLALAAALLFRGRSVEEAASLSRATLRGLDAGDRGAFERLRGLRTRLARLSLKLSLDGPGSMAVDEYQGLLKHLTDEGDALESALARRWAPLRALTALPPPAEIVERVAAALPRDGAFVELIAYTDRPLLPGPGAPDPRPPRYLALVLFPGGRTAAVDLGPTSPIDSAASQLRDELANESAGFQATARRLYQLAFRPLLPVLGATQKLYLVPDGQLALVSFAALHDGHRFLADTFDFTYLTGGRDLLPRPDAPLPRVPAVVLADPDFDMTPPAPVAAVDAGTFSGHRTIHSGAQRWSRLPGTRQEAEAVQRLFPQARLFLGADATKERLLHLEAPQILHIATHGLFLADQATPSGGPPPGPLLRSGLVLAGAGGSPDPGNSVVTALELASLDLWATQLVVLSACDTGRGDILLGQGVFGLRRALVIAGAETMVVSLWRVDDQTTRSMMERYYRGLLAGQGRAGALREAMLALRAEHPHPHHWAPFIALGRDAPLRGVALRPQPARE
jgi:tetratricopeptide (TPR) repeat protein